jgi:ribonuclease Z
VTALVLAGQTIEGFSVGGLETYIRLRELGLCFDIGRAPEESLSCGLVLFTHGHVDHLGGVVSHTASRALRGMSPPTYVVPPELAAPLEALLEIWRGIDGADLPCHVVPLGPGDELAHKRRYTIRPFRAPHFQPAQGYGIWERRTKLRAEFVGLAGTEIRDLRARGVDVKTETEVPLVSFTGDATSEVFDEDVVRRAKLSIFEVTFVDDRVSIASAREKGHLHLDEVVARAGDFECEAILMTHFSARYNARQIRAALDERLPASLRARTTPLLNRIRI